ncbi:aminotransferase class I/II-fold pyridoxal phosphate-dependent enzyme [Actinoplanes sp. NPDC051470]|uniref:aminotransferase-like domain-containing protein n=1 Tax=Actinoplanes sp. NPDC051470 TaxID=3157224 RepID=UPI003449B160
MFRRRNLLALIARAVEDRSSRGIAAAVSRLVTAGDLPSGSRLPTVRDVARELRVSPTTVSEAWQSLLRAGAIRTRGRSGTFVAALDRPRLRYAQLGGPALERDLSSGVPDHDLLPDLTEALKRVGDGRLTSSYLDAPVLPALEDVLRERWPFPPEAVTVVDGALDALDRIIGVAVRFGDRVVVENPTFPPLLDLLDTAGATVVPLSDLEGAEPVAIFIQPRAQNPTGATMSASDVAALAARLPENTIIVEDDHAGDIATATPVSLGTHRPDRTVHIAGFSKSHGPDLRLAAVGGPARIIEAVAARRLLGPGWSSRLLQAVLLDLLTSPASIAQVSTARLEYARRRASLLAALRSRQAEAAADDGINLWLTVHNQQQALVTLAAHGISVAPGAPFMVTPAATDHVRVTVGLVADGFDDLATILASAARRTDNRRLL